MWVTPLTHLFLEQVRSYQQKHRRILNGSRRDHGSPECTHRQTPKRLLAVPREGVGRRRFMLKSSGNKEPAIQAAGKGVTPCTPRTCLKLILDAGQEWSPFQTARLSQTNPLTWYVRKQQENAPALAGRESLFAELLQALPQKVHIEFTQLKTPLGEAACFQEECKTPYQQPQTPVAQHAGPHFLRHQRRGAVFLPTHTCAAEPASRDLEDTGTVPEPLRTVTARPAPKP